MSDGPPNARRSVLMKWPVKIRTDIVGAMWVECVRCGEPFLYSKLGSQEINVTPWDIYQYLRWHDALCGSPTAGQLSEGVSHRERN